MKSFAGDLGLIQKRYTVLYPKVGNYALESLTESFVPRKALEKKAKIIVPAEESLISLCMTHYAPTC